MKIKVNSKILIWAREELNLSQEEVAKRMDRKIEEIQAWESGEDAPTYAQLEKLSYTIYKRPLAVFFFSDEPNIKKQEKEFRTLENEIYKEIPTRILELINKARIMQLNLQEIEAKPRIKLTQLDFKIYGEDLNNRLRDIFNVSLEIQKKAKGIKDAFEMWRSAFYECGIYVFKDAFKDDSFSGFCLYDEEYPVIYINNSMSFSRQIFTLFHELYHLLLKTSGIDKTKDDYIDRLEEKNKKIEVLCNAFAGEFLVPNEDIIIEVDKRTIDEKLIINLSNKYNVSQEVILRKLLDLQKITKEFYQNKHEEYTKEVYRTPLNNGGGNYYNNQKSYLGENYITDVCKNYYEGKISIYDTAKYLNIKVETIPKLGILIKEGSR